MKVSMEAKKKEAVSRMKAIGIYPETIRQFEQEDLVSESAPPWGACYWINEEQQKRVKEFETENNALVYHIIHSLLNFGAEDLEMESYLFVSDDKQDWKNDWKDIEDKSAMQALCYVYDDTEPMFSEFGAVGFKIGAAGGLIRTF